MAKEEGKERRDPVTDAEGRDSAPPSSGQPESRDDARAPDSRSDAPAPDSRGDAPASDTGSERAAKSKEIDDRGESSGAFWFVVVGGAALAGWYLMHSSDNPSLKTSALVQPAMVEQAMEPGQPRAPEPAVAPPPAPPAIPTPSAAEPGGTVTAGGAADTADKSGTEQAAVAAGGPFDRAEALKALAASGAKAARCRAAGAPAGSTSVMVTLDPSGKVKSAKIVTAPYVGTPTATCITDKIAETTVPPFSGDAQAISVPVQVY